MMYIADWMPTLFSVAGINSQFQGPIDGVNMWPSISWNEKSPRMGFLINIDQITGYSSVRLGSYKYIRGATKTDPGWHGETGRNWQEEGTPPSYDPYSILKSPVNTVVMAAITEYQAYQLQRLRGLNDTRMDIGFPQILRVDEVMSLRKRAMLDCKVGQDQVASYNTLL